MYAGDYFKNKTVHVHGSDLTSVSKPTTFNSQFDTKNTSVHHS